MTTAPGPRPTIYDVAQEAGVSKSLVSLVLNDSDLVSEAKRAAVKQAMERLGYRRNRTASSLARSRTHTVGLVIDDFENPWFPPLLRGLQATLAPQGLHVAIREQLRGRTTGQNSIDDFLESDVDALVVAAEPLHDFEPLGVPAVVESTRLHSVAGADLVGSDQVQGAMLAVQHLHRLGHREIGHVAGRDGAAATRCAGYRGAMSDEGLEPLVATADQTTEDGGYRATVELLRRFPAVTSIFAANDAMALGARAALREAGRQVPDDVSLVGYDDGPLARSRFLSLTTVNPRNDEVGVLAGRALLRRLAGADDAPTEDVVLPVLVERSSTRRRDG